MRDPLPSGVELVSFGRSNRDDHFDFLLIEKVGAKSADRPFANQAIEGLNQIPTQVSLLAHASPHCPVSEELRGVNRGSRKTLGT
jgi:hypothetical protein